MTYDRLQFVIGVMLVLYNFGFGWSSCSAFGETGWEIVAASPTHGGANCVVAVNEPEQEKLAALRARLASGDSGDNSVLSKVVATPPLPSPTPGCSPAAKSGDARVAPLVPSTEGQKPSASPTPVVIVEKVQQEIAVPKKRVLSAVVGAPGSTDVSKEQGDLLDGVLEAQNGQVPTSDRTPSLDSGPSSPVPSGSPAVQDGVIITGESPSPAASVAPTPAGTATAVETPASGQTRGPSANPAVEEAQQPLPSIEPAVSPPPETGAVPGPSPSPSASPLVEATPSVQDKVYDLVSGQLPDRNSVRGPAQPRVGFYPKAPEPRTAQNVFLEASGGDLPKVEAELW